MELLNIPAHMEMRSDLHFSSGSSSSYHLSWKTKHFLKLALKLLGARQVILASEVSTRVVFSEQCLQYFEPEYYIERQSQTY